MKKYSTNKIIVPTFNEANGYYTTPGRSLIMKKVKSKNTKAEIFLRKKLWSAGIRYRKNYRKLIGTPDITITKKKIAIFIDGEFWHGKDWKIQKDKFKTNKSFWVAKIERNMQRDKEYGDLLENQGWIVLRFWEKEVLTNIDACINKIFMTFD